MRISVRGESSNIVMLLPRSVSQIRMVASRIKVHLSVPSMDRGIEIVRQFEQIFKPHRLMFRELNGINEATHITA